MCIKIFKNGVETPYDMQKPIEPQVADSTEISIDYEPNCDEISIFLKDVERCVDTGSNLNLNLKIKYGNFLMGYKLKKQMKKAVNDISLNEIIKLLVLSQHSADRKLEELANICSNRACDVK